MKKIIALLMVLIVCLSMTGCERRFSSVESLIRPPKISGNDSVLQTAFENSVSEYSDVVMKTPLDGKYRSSYILFDIDNDKTEEAIVLYSVPAQGDYIIADIFKYSNDEWHKISSVNSQCNDIYEVNFADINGDGCNEILFSWIEYNEDSFIDSLKDYNLVSSLMICSYDGKDVELIRSESYSKLYIKDINNNKSDEIFIFKNSISGSHNETTARLISFNEDYSVNFDDEINITSMLEIDHIVSDSIQSNGKNITRVYVDGSVDEHNLITEIIEIDEETFDVKLPLYNENQTSESRTLRVGKNYCFDIDWDGVIDIPTVDIFPYSITVSNGQKNPMKLIIWSEYSDNKFTVKYKTIMNSKVGHTIFIPESYLGKVAAIYDDDNMNLTFYSIDSKGTFKNALFSFRIFTIPDWEENNYGYEKFSENETYVYSYLIFKGENYDKYKKFIDEHFFTI